MKLEGQELRRHLERMHRIVYFASDADAEGWHALAHKYGDKHQHEVETRQEGGR